MFNFWHSGTLALSPECQSAWMSEIKNGGLDQYGAEPFEQQQFWTVVIEGVNIHMCIMVLLLLWLLRTESGDKQTEWKTMITCEWHDHMAVQTVRESTCVDSPGRQDSWREPPSPHTANNIQPINQSINQSIKQSINQAINQSSNQSIKQSINQPRGGKTLCMEIHPWFLPRDAAMLVRSWEL